MATDAGRQAADYPEGVLTSEELQRRVMKRLPGPERRILEVIVFAYPKQLANDDCARRSGYEPGGTCCSWRDDEHLTDSHIA